MKTKTKVETQCYHCGDTVLQPSFSLDAHDFCCLGCQTVYQILHASKLQGYYVYNTHPGQSKKSAGMDLSYLDEPNIVSKLVDYEDADVVVVTFFIPVIHCSSCIWLLENLYKLNGSIPVSRVDFMKKQVTITFKKQAITLRNVVELLNKIGYEPKITLQDVIKASNKINQNRLVSKITVAGFCFGNSMMISFPEYFGMATFEREYADFFGYMNLAFGVPVLLYSASDYFKSAWFSLKQRRLNLDVPLALGILVLFLRSAWEIISHTGAGFMDTLCSLVFFILIGKWVQHRTYHHISFERDYKSYFPVAVTVINQDGERPTQISDLQVGDRILVRNNEIIPADSILLKGEGSVDFSFVTGESKTVEKTLGEIVYAGGKQVGKAIELEVIKAVSQSYLTKLWNDEGIAYKKKFETFVGMISKYFTVVLIATAASAAIFWIYNGESDKAWAAFTAVLIIACPCALALSSPFTLSAALRVFDKNKMYIKNTQVIEQMAAINTMVFDKTGTITSPNAAHLFFEGSLTLLERQLVASLCRNSNHPLSRELNVWLNVSSDLLSLQSYTEIIGQGQEGTYEQYTIRLGSANFVGVTKPKNGFDGTEVYVEINKKIKGIFTMEQAWRDGLSTVVGKLKNEAYKIHLISGDNERRADAMRLIFPKKSRLLFNQSPKEKLDHIQQWQLSGDKVCMVGDGLNDAGALRVADMGIAVSDDINNFSPGCDAILDGASFYKIPQFFSFAKDAVRVIKMSFVISLLYNIVGISFAVQGAMSPLFAAILMPISTVTIISFTSLATRWFAKRKKLL